MGDQMELNLRCRSSSQSLMEEDQGQCEEMYLSSELKIRILRKKSQNQNSEKKSKKPLKNSNIFFTCDPNLLPQPVDLCDTKGVTFLTYNVIQCDHTCLAKKEENQIIMLNGEIGQYNFC